MPRGSKRSEIINNCPDGFEDVLNEFIDDIEERLCDILGMLEVNSVGDLRKIEDAERAIDDLKDSLF